MEMWNPNGETKYCFPDVLRGVTDKTTRVDSTGINPGTIKGGVTDETTGGTAATDNSSGCSIGGRKQAAWLWCPLAGLVATWFGRRRR